MNLDKLKEYKYLIGNKPCQPVGDLEKKKNDFEHCISTVLIRIISPEQFKIISDIVSDNPNIDKEDVGYIVRDVEKFKEILRNDYNKNKKHLVDYERKFDFETREYQEKMKIWKKKEENLRKELGFDHELTTYELSRYIKLQYL